MQGIAGERGTRERKEKTVCKSGNVVLFYTAGKSSGVTTATGRKRRGRNGRCLGNRGTDSGCLEMC